MKLSRVTLRFVSIGLALSCVSLLLMLLLANSRSLPKQEVKYIVREVDTAVLLPPPPPPKPVESKSAKRSRPKMDLRYQGKGPQLALADTKDLSSSQGLATMPSIEIETIDLNKLSTDEFTSFSLSELDKLPVLMTPLRFNFPPYMRREKIRQFEAKLLVQINDKGRVKVLNIIENPYPDLNDRLIALAEKAQFTAPVHQGELVTTEFIWPLELTDGWKNK